MGLQTSSLTTMLAGDTMDSRYDIYKIKKVSEFEYFKVKDLIDAFEKKALEQVPLKNEMALSVFKKIKELNHANIMRLDYFIDKQTIYVVRSYDDDYYGFAWRLQIERFMEYDWQKKVQIDEEQIIYWMKQLLTAVDCLHKNNILHQFITPETISFKRDQLKLFITAESKILSESAPNFSPTQTWYRCPEFDKNKTIDLKYDIWSAGWTLFTLCSLEDSQYVLEGAKNFDEWVKPDLARKYTRDLDKLFKLMTLLDPKSRPTASELLNDQIFKGY